MDYIELLGFLSSGLVFATFWMKTMVPLRAIAIASNILFFAYGFHGGLIPIMLLHGLLLPLNGLRLFQVLTLKRQLQEIAHGEFDPTMILPFMTQSTYPKGTYLFRAGDHAENMFYLFSGRVQVVELGIDIPPGSLIGEIGVFSPERRRTQSIVCLEDCVLFQIEEEKVLQMCTENPEFGIYLTKMMVACLLSNNSQKAQLAEAE